MQSYKTYLLHDATIIAMSIVAAVVLVKSNVLIQFLTSTREFGILGSFIAGLFFTSIFTTAPAIAALGGIAQIHSVVLTAFFGAMGAVVGDLIIFRFIKNQFAEHLMLLVQHRDGKKRIRHLFQKKIFRWFTFLVGGLIIASPLPDELGITLLGFSKMRASLFIPLSFVCNFLGILLIGLAARSL